MIVVEHLHGGMNILFVLHFGNLLVFKKSLTDYYKIYKRGNKENYFKDKRKFTLYFSAKHSAEFSAKFIGKAYIVNFPANYNALSAFPIKAG